ncbi:MAG TPA: hypothetical protein VNV84_01420 [Candidatus Acidoferrales bacterium]|nr:hypothetical protein [Candidatus Acidoferrales bacterium]
MSTPLDLFVTESGGKVRWVAAVRTLEEAQSRVEEVAMRSPGEYFVFNQESNSRIHLPLDGSTGMRGSRQKSILEENLHDK